MKRVLALLLALAVAVLAGCQATPEQSIVIQKDLEQMISQAQSTPEESAGTLAERLGIPENLQMELVSTKGRLKVHVDANVTLPDVQALSTVRVGRGEFTQEDVMRLYETLCGDAMPVDPVDTGMTQAYKMLSIQDLLEQQASGNYDTGKYESMEEVEAAIEKAMQEAAGLPEHFTRIEPDFSFVPQENGSAIVQLRVAPDDATLSDLHIINATGQTRVEYFRDLRLIAALSNVIISPASAFRETQSPYFVPPAMSEDDAFKLAQDTVSSLGLSNFVCSGSRLSALYNEGVDAADKERQGVYEFMFTRKIAGVAITYTNDEGNETPAVLEGEENDYYAMPWLYEKVRVIIDDSGIVAFIWNSPYIATETVTENTTMLPFEDICNTFENMITVVNNIYDTAGDGTTCDMTITEVRLGLMRVTEEDVGTSGLVIPVWDFFGHYENSNGTVYGRDGYSALLTINAIDGTIIDRNLGY